MMTSSGRLHTRRMAVTTHVTCCLIDHPPSMTSTVVPSALCVVWYIAVWWTDHTHDWQVYWCDQPRGSGNVVVVFDWRFRISFESDLSDLHDVTMNSSGYDDIITRTTNVATKNAWLPQLIVTNCTTDWMLFPINFHKSFYFSLSKQFVPSQIDTLCTY